MFWVASAPLSPDGHVNLSPKGTADSFHVMNSRQVWYQDLSGSGVETISHIRENGRVTILFSAFEGPPRILRLFGTGTVYEYGTEEYESLISPETRKPGSRAAIVIDVYQCQTSCGFAVPIYNFVTHRTQLLRMANIKESCDHPSDPEIHQKGIKAYWARMNLRSVDGLPGLLTAPDSKVIPVNNFDKESQRPKLRYSSSREGSAQSSGINLAISFALGALVATTLPYILSATRKFDMFTTRA